MKSQWKRIVVCFVLAASMLLHPVQSVYAGRASGDESVPYINKSEVKFNKKSFFNWFGLSKIPDENIIEEFVVAHYKVQSLDYSLYDLVCDFELKTKDGEDVYTSSYSYTIDFENYEKGLIDTFLVYFNLKDDYYEHVFDYRDIVSQAEYFEERDVTGKGNYIYNTVISQLDLYFVRKSDGAAGAIRRFNFTWDSNFWSQTCNKITFSWVYETEEGEEEKEISNVESEVGVEGMATSKDSYLDIEESSIWDEIGVFLVGVPTAVIAFLTGFADVCNALKDLFVLIFPFIPVSVINIFIALMLFVLVMAIYKLVKGVS